MKAAGRATVASRILLQEYLPQQVLIGALYTATAALTKGTSPPITI